MIVARRQFLASSLALAASPAAAAGLGSSKPMRILMLGGTNYVGPHIVHSALRAGHEVTLFNRGRTNPHLFHGLEKLWGDRTHANGLEALGRTRAWDAVIDTWSKAPRAVEASAALLKDRSSTYAYISSIAVYGGFRKIGLTEADPILPISQRPAGDGDEVGYVWAKRLAEDSVARHFRGAHVIARGSSIFGFDSSADPTNQNAYWPLRLRAGGAVLAPGDGNDLIQYTDVGSIADFVIANLGTRVGAVNVAAAPVSFREYLETARAAANPQAELVWVPQEFLMANGGTPFEKVPLWIPADDPEPGFFRFDTARAHSAGMPLCQLPRTVTGVLAGFAERPAHWQPDWAKAGGMPLDLERSILTKWRSRSS